MGPGPSNKNTELAEGVGAFAVCLNKTVSRAEMLVWKMSMSVSDDTCTCGMDERDERRLKHFHRAFSTGQHIWWWPKLCYIGRGSNIFCDYCFHSAYREVHNRDLDHIVHRSFFSFLSLFKKSFFRIGTYVELEIPPPCMAKTILNFHFDYLIIRPTNRQLALARAESSKAVI